MSTYATSQRRALIAPTIICHQSATSTHRPTPEIPRIHFCSCVYIKKNIDYRYSFIYTLNRLTGTITKHKVDMLFYKNYADAHDKNREFYYISDTTNSYVHSCDIDVDDNIYSFLKNVYSYYFSSLVNFLL